MIANVLLGVLITLFLIETVGYLLLIKAIVAFSKAYKKHVDAAETHNEDTPESQPDEERDFPTLVFRSMSEAEDAVEACQEILDETGFLTLHQYYEHGEHVLKHGDTPVNKSDLDVYGWVAHDGAAIFNIVVHKPAYGDRIEGLDFDGDIYEVRYVDDPEKLKESK